MIKKIQICSLIKFISKTLQIHKKIPFLKIKISHFQFLKKRQILEEKLEMIYFLNCQVIFKKM